VLVVLVVDGGSATLSSGGWTPSPLDPRWTLTSA
jgi:hypothetical protein